MEAMLEMNKAMEVEEEKKVKHKYEIDKILIVYHDEVFDRYFIDVFAAVELGFMDYKVACKMDYDDMALYEISKQTLNMLENNFPNKIMVRSLSLERRGFERNLSDSADISDIINSYYKIKNDLNQNNIDIGLLGEDTIDKYKDYKQANSLDNIELPMSNFGSNDMKDELSRMYDETRNDFDQGNNFTNRK